MLKKHFYFVLIFLVLILLGCRNPQTGTVQIHYHRFDQSYEGWTLWTWLDETKIELEAVKQDSFGLVFNLKMDAYPAMGSINFLPKYKNWENKDDPNRSWSRSMPHEIWILEGEAKVFNNQPGTGAAIRRAFLDGPDSLTLVLSHPLDKKNLETIKPAFILNSGKKITARSIRLVSNGKTESKIVSVRTDAEIEPAQLPARVEAEGYRSGYVFLRSILDNRKYETDEPLGLFYTPQNSRFAVYAPAARLVRLNLFKQPEDGLQKSYELQPGSGGVWKTQVDGNLAGRFYTYSIFRNDGETVEEKEIIDPYAKAVTRYNGRGIIVYDTTRVPDGPDFPLEQAVIYEMHVRDFSISEDSGIRYKGKFLGFTESGTTLPGGNLSTGIDGLAELGINTVQLMPVQDFEFDPQAGGYFWGYMTVNFNAPEGWYATRRDDASAVHQFKLLVKALHQKGIKVVMDVVYNHTSESNGQICYNFNGLAPDYYYRQKADGSYWNGSGCGNELRTENPMVRRFLLESLAYWVQEYNVDGFRFDLMGLFDKETMHDVVTTLKEIKPGIFIYGEPWTAGDTPISPTVKGTQRGQGFSVFNDHFRDALKGPWYNTEPGYIQTGKNMQAVKKGIMGSIDDFAAEPYESINYVAVHDGRTLWDQLKASTKTDSSVTEEQLVAMDKLAAAILFTSQGVPFIHGGQEMLRTKFGAHNSYNQPDEINKIRWEWKQKNLNVFKYYQGLIKLRREHPLFRMTSAAEIRENLKFYSELKLKKPAKGIGYLLKKGDSADSWNEVLVLINPNRQGGEFQIPQGKWNMAVNGQQAGTETIRVVSGVGMTVNPISAMVLWR